MTLERCLILAWILFAIGAYGLITRRHLLGSLMAIEMMLNAANINFIAFVHFGSPQPVAGTLFALFVIAVSACELAVALAIVIVLYRKHKHLDSKALNELRG